MRVNRAVIGLTASAIAVGLMAVPVADAGLVNKPNKLVQPKIKQDIKVVPTKGEAVSSPGQKVASDKSVASKSKLSKSKQKLVNRLPKYLSGSPTPANISRLAGKLKSNSQRTSSVRSYDCTSPPPPNPNTTRCWYYDWIRSAGGSSVINGRSERRQGKMSCGQSSSSDYLMQDNPAFRRNPSGPDVDYRAADYQEPFMWVDRAAMQIGSHTPNCRFKPAVRFSMQSRQAGQSAGNTTITTDYAGLQNNLPIEDVYLNFPQGLKIDNTVVPASGQPLTGTYKADACSTSSSDVGNVSTILQLYLKDFPLINLQTDTTGEVCVTTVDSTNPQPGDRIGRIDMYIRSKVLGAQSGDDLNIPIILTQGNGYVKAEMLDVPRFKDDVELPGGATLGVYIELKQFDITFNGNLGSGSRKLLKNPAASECKSGDRANYSAIHKSWLNDLKWNPNNGTNPDNKTYYEIAWASAGQYQGCTG